MNVLMQLCGRRHRGRHTRTLCIVGTILFLGQAQPRTCDAALPFQRAVGGSDYDVGRSIVQTADGGYVVAGRTESFGEGNADVYIVKLADTGVLEWTKTYGGFGLAADLAFGIIQTADGGYAVAGWTNEVGSGNPDVYLLKLDGSGVRQWSRTVGSALNDFGVSAVQSTDGGYAIAGLAQVAGLFDFYVVKLNGSGGLQWTRTVAGSGDDVGWSIVQAADGGYAACGYTNSVGAGAYDMYIVKLDGSGALQWTRTVGGGGDDYGWSMIQTTDHGYVIAGQTSSFGAGGADVYITKLDSSGALQWTRTVGGSGDDYGHSVVQTVDGGYAIAGETASFGAGEVDVYLVKLDGSGALQWTRTVGGIKDDRGWSIAVTTGGGCAIGGETESSGVGEFDCYIVTVDGSGNTCGSTSSGGIAGTGGTVGSGGTAGSAGTSSGTGGTTAGGGGVDTEMCVATNVVEMVGAGRDANELENYPNPFNPVTRIRFVIPSAIGTSGMMARLVVCDILGREVETLVDGYRQPGNNEIEWDASTYPSGVYYCTLVSGVSEQTRAMILMK